MGGIIILITLIVLSFFCMCIETFLNLILKKGAPFIGFKRFVSAAERFRLAHRVRHSSENLKREYQESLNAHKSGVTAGIAIFAAVIFTSCLLTAVHIPVAMILILALIESIGILYFVNAKEAKTKYEDSLLLKKCGKCAVVEVYFYQSGRTPECYVTVRMPDGSEYRMIPVINYWRYTEYSHSVSEGIVYYKKLPFAKCCVLMGDRNFA